jgi:hypothetical protein
LPESPWDSIIETGDEIGFYEKIFETHIKYCNTNPVPILNLCMGTKGDKFFSAFCDWLDHLGDSQSFGAFF